LSPRAACRLETLGFESVYDYVPGKVDWLARGLPTEGEDEPATRAGQLARDDAATCRLGDPAERVRELIEASPYGFCLVLAEHGTLLGRVRMSTLKDGARGTAEDVMEPGPSTVRYDLAADELRNRLEKRDLKTAIVTTPEGKLVGVVRRADLDG
jgi:CBS-domain-containing membrane protein